MHGPLEPFGMLFQVFSVVFGVRFREGAEPAVAGARAVPPSSLLFESIRRVATCTMFSPLHPVFRSVSFPLAVVLLAVLFAGCQASEGVDMPAEEEMTAAPVELTEVWTLTDGLNRPESAIYDPERSVLYVSNINFDGPGHISKISLDGASIDSLWVPGLAEPKGMALGEGVLYVTDKNTLLAIDLDSGEITARHEVAGDDVYLNDVAMGEDGTVYVSDSRFSKVYALQDGMFDVWLAHENVLMPNGVHVVGDELYIAAGDSTAEEPGNARYLQAISLADHSVRALHGTEPEGALDAIEPDGAGGLFVSDWGGGRLMHYRDGEGLTLLRTPGQGTADVEFVAETQMLYVPVMMSSQLIAFEVSL